MRVSGVREEQRTVTDGTLPSWKRHGDVGLKQWYWSSGVVCVCDVVVGWEEVCMCGGVGGSGWEWVGGRWEE